MLWRRSVPVRSPTGCLVGVLEPLHGLYELTGSSWMRRRSGQAYIRFENDMVRGMLRHAAKLRNGHAVVVRRDQNPFMMKRTTLRLLVLVGLLAACGSPVTIASPTATSSATTTTAPPTVVAATPSPTPSAAATPGLAFQGYPCGRVTAYTPPTATAAGSIQIGTTTFAAVAGSLPNPPPPIAIGAVLCLTGRLDSSGAFTSLTASDMGEQMACGTVTGFTPASATAAGSITLRTNASWTLPVRAGVTVSSAGSTAAHCFKFEVNAAGNAEVVG